MRGIRVGTVFDIPVKINWTFLIVLPLFAAFIALDVTGLAELINATFATSLDPDALSTGSLPWILGFASALGLFVGVILHEFGHSLVARYYGYEIDSITLWLLGGMAQFTEFPENWRHEFVISLAGPVVSILVGVASYVGFLALSGGFASARFVLGYLAILNVVLAVFNLLPGFPMDGGRILRALLARNMPHAQATKRAAEIGKIFAFVLGLVGLFANLFLVLLAFFIYMAASSEAQQTSIKAAFEGISVRDIMTSRDALKTVAPTTSITELVQRMFEERHVGYPVVERGELIGMVTLDDAARVEEFEQDAYRVEDVMTSEVETITPDADALTAFQRMQAANVGRLPVVDESGSLVGLISRTDLMRAFNVMQTMGENSAARQPEPELLLER